LVVEPDRGGDLEREAAVAAHERGREPGTLRGLGLALDRRDVLPALRIDVGRAALEIAIDAKLVDLPRDPVAGRLVRARVKHGSVASVTLLELVIDQAVLRRDLRGAAAGHAAADARRVEKRDRAARTLQ